MRKVDKISLCNEIYELKRAKEDLIKPIEEKYQKCIDDIIYQELPFHCGDIIKDKSNSQVRFFIYKGIKKEAMVLYGCDKDGVENNENTQYHWSIYEDFVIHKEVE